MGGYGEQVTSSGLGDAQVALFRVRKIDGAAAAMLVVRSKSVVWILSLSAAPS